jgi:hypothetical protein
MKTQLIARARSLALILATVATALLLSGCCCTKQSGGGAGLPICPDNVKHGVPLITCQPVDTAASPGTTAMLYTEALGENLQYQWFAWDVPSQKWVAKNGAIAPTLTISPVSIADYGLYYCQITANNNNQGPVISRTREAALGGVATPGGTGGTFTAVTWPTVSGGTRSICGSTVSGVKVNFYPPTQIPDPGKTGWAGGVYRKSDGVQVPNSNFKLQWFVSVTSTDCCSASGTFNVTCPVTSGLTYRFICHFIVAPPVGEQYELRGSWTP